MAATTRTSTSTVCDPPTRSNRRSWSTRSSLACMASGISPTSSRKIVPPWASSNRPLRWPTALVKAPFSWPNSSLSSRVLGEGRAVDRDERGVAARRGVVDGPRHQLFAGSGLADDQDRADRLGDVADQLEDVVHPRALAQDVVKLELLVQLLAQGRDLVLQRPLAQRTLDDQPQVLEVDRLGQEVGGPQPHRLHRMVDRAESRRDDHVRGQPALLHFFEQLQPVDARHLQVGDDHAVGTLGQGLERIAAVGGGVHRDSGSVSRKTCICLRAVSLSSTIRTRRFDSAGAASGIGSADIFSGLAGAACLPVKGRLLCLNRRSSAQS